MNHRTDFYGIGFLTRTLGMILICFLLAGCGRATEESYLKIGLPEEPRSLNPWLGTDANSRKIISQIYQPLFLRHPHTLKIIPWLAREAPEIDDTGTRYTIKLRKAKWSDGSAFTARDVIFTRKLFMDFK
ncbi:MAG: ABC transporter substrate-binding protein, partial [Desulfobacterales bacterium]|nr:ABC transporter substrate-binding protein [Desulfobacterales bacterium]